MFRDSGKSFRRGGGPLREGETRDTRNISTAGKARGGGRWKNVGR